MVKKTLLVCLTVALLLGTMLPPVMAEEKTVITMAVSGSVSEIALRYETAELYESLHPNVKIEWIDLGDVTQRVIKTMALVSSGTAPDILYMNNNIYTFTVKGVLHPLTEFIEKEPEGFLDYFYDSLLAPLTYKGELYALPQEVSPTVEYYNKDLFAKYNVPLPKDDWTFEEWYATVKALADAGRADQVYGESIVSSIGLITAVLSRLGVQVYTDDMQQLWLAQPENREKTIEAFTWLQKAVMEDKICPNPAEVTAMGQGFNQAFRNQQIAMQAAGLYLLPDFKDVPLTFDWDVVMQPLKADGERTARAAMLNWGIWSGSKQKEAAWDVLKFFVGHEGQMIVAKHNMALPGARDEEANQLIIDSGFPPNIMAFIETVDYIENPDSFSLCAPEINNLILAEIQSMVLGDLTPEEALDNIIDAGVDILAEAIEANS